MIHLIAGILRLMLDSASINCASTPFNSPCQQHLCQRHRVAVHVPQVQEVVPAGHIRALWRKHHEAHGYDAFQVEWQRALSLVASPCPTPVYLPSSDSLGSMVSSQTEGPK